LPSGCDTGRESRERRLGSVLALGNKAGLTDPAFCALIAVVCCCLLVSSFSPQSGGLMLLGNTVSHLTESGKGKKVFSKNSSEMLHVVVDVVASG